jgi:hypothetical protein
MHPSVASRNDKFVSFTSPRQIESTREETVRLYNQWESKHATIES